MLRFICNDETIYLKPIWVTCISVADYDLIGVE